MTRSRHTYEHLARATGVRWCQGITPTGHYCHERHGMSGTITPGCVHITDRSPNLAATVWFLRLAARALDPSIDEDIPWRRAYRVAKGVHALSRKAHVRIPRRVYGFERAFVLAGVAGLTNEVPLRKQAFDWARR